MWKEPPSVAAQIIEAVLYLDVDGFYRIYDLPHATTAGFQTSAGTTTIVPGSTAPQRIAHIGGSIVRILP